MTVAARKLAPLAELAMEVSGWLYTEAGRARFAATPIELKLLDADVFFDYMDVIAETRREFEKAEAARLKAERDEDMKKRGYRG
jgi:hypothetical protein